tara:strand:- start:294 stop:476 length:183 start_codon:yes stop_codon:yes gene_type:complete
MKYKVAIHEALDNVYVVDVEAASEREAVNEAEKQVIDGKVDVFRTIKIGYEYGHVESEDD